jgi:hypothetical protein
MIAELVDSELTPPFKRDSKLPYRFEIGFLVVRRFDDT